jgi:ubiquitin-conjugating enzyme E2 variant
VALDGASLVLFTASLFWLFSRVASPPPLLWWIPLALAAGVGLCAADVATGATHWLFDRCFDETTPVLGRVFVQPFREHHRDPMAITRHGFLEVSGNNALALCPVLWLGAGLAPGFGAGLVETLWLGFVLAAVAGAFVTNSIHRWAHAVEAPRFVRWLQRRGVILTPDHHALHHQGAHDRAYCVTTGWMNPLLDGLGVFRSVERIHRPRRVRP